MSYDIFLSYRRKDASGHSNVGNSRTIKYAFEAHGYEVFFDFSDCTDGYFAEKILPAIRTCRYFVLVLSKGCLERCKEEGDWLRREIEEALKYGRKIIPVSPDGEFEGWPTDLPESIKALSANNGLQITTIHMDGIFEANMEQLIKDRRMAPPQRRKDDGLENCAKLKVKSNLDCLMYVDEEECANIVANKLEKIPLKPGEYMLKFESVENAVDCVEEDFVMPDKDKLYKVDLLSIERERREREAQGESEVNGVKFKMVKVEGGTFMIGATEEQGTDALDWEKPVHQVTLSDYYIGETVVTQELWKAVMGNNPSRWEGNDLPVEMVSWEDAQEFIEKLNRETGWKFRLPTEAEWEYAARGGKKSQRYKYSGSDNLDEVAWYDGNSKVNSGKMTHLVKEKKANELGLYDMSGNVWEWCQDWYGEYSGRAQTNPQGPSSGADRVCRGGGWATYARGCRVSNRSFEKPANRDDISRGFRLVVSL